MLTDADLAKISKLAKISVAPNESADLIQKLSQILDAVSSLSDVDTKNVEPLFHLSEAMVMRQDQGRAPLDRNDLLKNAPDHNHESFALPRAFGSVEDF